MDANVLQLGNYEIDFMFHESGWVFLGGGGGKLKKNVKMQLICTRNPASFPGLRTFIASSKNYRTASDERTKAWERD